MIADALMSRHTSAWQAATIHPYGVPRVRSFITEIKEVKHHPNIVSYFSSVNCLTSMYPSRNSLAQPVRYFM